MTVEEVRTTPCPDEERLGAFVEGILSGAARDDVQEHVARCASCVDVVAAALPAARRAHTATAAVERGPAARSRHRFAWAATLALAIGGLALAAAQGSIPGLGFVAGRAASRWLGAEVRVAAIRARLGPSGTFVLGLHGLRFEHGQNLVWVDDIEATVALASLVSGDSSLRRLVLVRPRLEVARPAGIGIVASRDARGRIRAALETVERVDVVDGTIVFRDAASDSPALEGVTGGIELRDGEVRMVLQGRLGGGMLDVTGTIGAGDAALALSVAGRDVAASAIALLEGRMDGRTEMHLDVLSDSDGVRLDGRVAMRDGRWIGGGPVRTLDLDQTARRALLATSPGLAGEDLPFDELRAVFAWQRGTWGLPRVFVKAGELVAGGEARVRADGSVEGRGTIRLPATLVRELAPYGAALAGYLEAPGSATLPFLVRGSVSAPRFALDAP